MSQPTLTANGTTSFLTFPGREYSLAFSGSFGGGSLAIEYQIGATWNRFEFSPLTTGSNFRFIAPSKAVRLVLSGSTSSDIAIAFSIAVDGAILNSYSRGLIRPETGESYHPDTPTEVLARINARALRFDQDQTLSTADQLQARQNAGAASQADLDAEETARAAAVTSLQSAITALQSILAADDVDLDTAQERIDFIKNLSTELDGLGIADILGLQAALDAEAEARAAADLEAGLSGNSFIAAYGDGADAVANGEALKDAYTAAKALTPNGAALSATNRACVLVFSGRYDLVAATDTNGITLDAEFVDLIGVGARENVWITSVGRTVAQTANDVLIQGMTLESASDAVGISNDVAYYPNTNLPLTKMKDVNCVGTNKGRSHRNQVDFSGTFTNCTAGDAGFGGSSGTASGTFTDCTAGESSFGGSGGTASGTFTGCTAGDESFGSQGTASGTFTNCTAGGVGFGGSSGTASGTFTDCTAGEYSFGGNRNFGGGGTATGTFTRCTAGNRSFGGNSGTASGTFTGCTAGDESFGSEGTASGTFTNCTAGGVGFGGVGTASGTFTDCTAGEYSFGRYGTFTGNLYKCRVKVGEFETVSGGGITRLCLDGSSVENNQG